MFFEMGFFSERKKAVYKISRICYDENKKRIASFGTAASPVIVVSRLTCRLGGCYFFMHIMHKVITPMITKQKENNPSYVTIQSPPFTESD